jgi:NADPH-dependent 2,4-dienoyl-CoA reductase/sulfur reductase-like enzyme/rhodanese-related sulfurtransferase
MRDEAGHRMAVEDGEKSGRRFRQGWKPASSARADLRLPKNRHRVYQFWQQAARTPAIEGPHHIPGKFQPMPQRIVIVGGVAAGASAAAKARRTNEQADIVLIDSGPYISFANCGLPYFVGGEIASRDALFVSNPARFNGFFRVDVRLSTKVVDVSPADRQVSFVGPDGVPGTLGYDRLILATGTVPLVPPIPGLDGPNIFFCRTVPDVDAIMERVSQLLQRDQRPNGDGGSRALVIGGGYIGLECAEQLLHKGFRVTLVEALNQLMSPLDPEMAYPVQTELQDAGAAVITGDAVLRIEPAGDRSMAVLKSGREVSFDLAIVGTGVRPNVELARSAGLKLGKTGAIAVDAHQRTSDPAIFAAGDNCETVFLPTGDVVNIPLAGPANKQGRIAGQNAALDLAGAARDDGQRLSMRGVLGTAVVRVGRTVAGGTGLTEKVAKRVGIDAAVTYVFGPNHASYYPGAKQMLLKLLCAPASGRILGAQAVGQEGVDKRLDIFATAIQGEMTVEDLEHLDLCYAPPFGSAKDVVLMAGFASANAHRKTGPGVSPLDLGVEMSSDRPPFLIDVRTRREYQEGRLRQAVNIPLDELRQRRSEIPKDRAVVVQCGTGYRSYVAQRILLNSGWTDVRNLWGGFTLARRIPGLLAAEEENVDVTH